MDSLRKQKVLTLVWLTIQACVFAFVICGFAVPADGDVPKSYQFIAVFDVILALALSVGGTLVLRKHRTPGALGFLVGVSLMMSLVMLSNAVLAGGDLNDKHETAAVKATCAFSVFLFLLYACFTAMLVLWKSVLITEPMSEQLEDNEAEAPKAEGQSSEVLM